MLKIDVSAFQAYAGQLKESARQVPFAASKVLNAAAFQARTKLVTDTWPRSVTVRNKSFMRAALKVEKASKAKLKVAIVDQLNRASLTDHADGGMKRARIQNLAIPTDNVKVGASGVRKYMKPRNLARSFVRNGVIYQATGKGKRSKIKAMYVLRPTARIKKDVPFREDFATVITQAFRKDFAATLRNAMQPRRK